MGSKTYSHSHPTAPVVSGPLSSRLLPVTGGRGNVVLVERVFSHYRQPVYDALDREVGIRLLFGKNNSGIHPGCADYAETIPSLQYGPGETHVLLFPLRRIRQVRPEVVVFDFALGMLNLPWILSACRRLGIRTAFWSHAYNRKTGFCPEHSALDQYRLFQLKKADALILYTQSDKAILEKYIPSERLFVAQNTLNTPALFQIRNALEREGREAVKTRCKIRHTWNIGFIGRLLSAKKPELLLAVYDHIRTQYGVRLGVHFIGDGEMLPLIREQAREKSMEEDVYFHGPIHDDQLSGELLFCFDLMVMPGDLGLSVNHAFCFNCPVVSFQRGKNGPFHGPEAEYVTDGETGFMVWPQTPQAMGAAIFHYLTDGEMKRRFSMHVRYAAEHVFPLEKMVGGVEEAIHFLVRSKREHSFV